MVVDWLPYVFGGGGLIATVVSLATLRSQVRKTQADTMAVVTESALSLLRPSKEEARELLEKLQKANVRADSVEEKLREAQGQVRVLSQRVDALTDRLKLAQRLLDERGVPFPPLPEI